MQGALDGTIDRDRYTAFPPENLDESYRVVADAEAARATGDLSGFALLPYGVPEFDLAIEDVYRRFDADALRFVLGPGRPATEADLGAELWANIGQWAVGGKATLYVVDHPASTDPALREERVIAFRLREPAVDTWSYLVLPPPTGT
jgi:hypothetical protein